MTVCFGFNSSVLDDHSRQALDNIVLQLDSLSDYTIHLSGHTDNAGSDTYNEKLSENRARAVRNYFISKNVDSTKIQLDFYGESQPTVPNTTEENRALNRRVEITVSGEKTSITPEKPTSSETALPEPKQQYPAITSKKQEAENIPAKAEIKKKKVRRRLVWTGWRTGYHWSTSGK